MKEFIDKLIEKLEEELIPLNQEITKYFYELKDTDNPKYIYSVGRSNALTDFKYTINQLAEEYKVSEMPTGSEDYCEWVLIDYEANVYDTTCRNPHILLEGSPTDNSYEFCPYCGKKIKVAPYTEGE